MAYVKIDTRTTQKTDLALNWSNNNPILLKGEIGIAIDTGVMKIGDGATTWNELTEFGAFTEALKTKLENIESGAQVNQNAFSHIKVGDVNIDADISTDTLEIRGEGYVEASASEDGAAVVISVDKTALDNAYASKDTEEVAAGAVKKTGDTMTGPLVLHGVPTEDLHAATKAYVDSIISANDAMVFKGKVGLDNPLPTEGYEKGWTYRVVDAGTYAGYVCEIGDVIMVLNDYVAETASDADFFAVQANIDGAVTTTNTAGSVTTGEIAVFEGTSGKVIKSSGLTIKTSVPENAVFTDTTYDIADETTAGLVASSSLENGVAVAADGKMSVNSINVNKLVISDGDTLILDCGNSEQ